jgi:hypothetical protein
MLCRSVKFSALRRFFSNQGHASTKPQCLAAPGGPRSNQVGTLRAAAWHGARRHWRPRLPPSRSLRYTHYTALDHSGCPPPQQRGTRRAHPLAGSIFSNRARAGLLELAGTRKIRPLICSTQKKNDLSSPPIFFPLPHFFGFFFFRH